MPVSVEEIKNLAELARLRLSEAEVEGLAKDMERILEYMAKLEEIDTSGVEPLSHVHAASEALRDDNAQESIPRERALENAPDSDGVHFRVPKVIE